MAGKVGGGRGFKGGGVGGGGGGGGFRGNNQNHQQQNIRDKREEIKNFLGFYKRTDSVCIDLYQPEFYRRRPSWEEMAVFVSQQLFLSATLKASLKDIQLHPVKKHLFIKFRDTLSRDMVATKLKTGVEWPAFEAKVHGWAMDKPVIVVRLHGVSPESTKQEIEAVMVQYGDVLDADIGYISKKLLPGVTNGTWTVKMILHEGKVLPSFVFMKEEGEVWQVTHENQVNVCWKCGLVGHVGAKCHQPTLTFDALDGVQTVAEGDGGVGGAGAVKSWAHVVRSGSCQSTSVSVSQSELVKQENLMRKLKDQEIRKLEQAAADKALTGKVDEVAADESADNALVVEEQVAAQDVPDSLAISQDDQFAAQQKVFVHDRDSSEDASDSESGDPELALSLDKSEIKGSLKS